MRYPVNQQLESQWMTEPSLSTDLLLRCKQDFLKRESRDGFCWCKIERRFDGPSARAFFATVKVGLICKKCDKNNNLNHF